MTNRVVTTVNGARYRLTKELGRGGQGAVFRTEEGRHAVKLLRVRSPRAREALRDRLAMVKRLPIEELDLARPLDQLREPDLGYVMALYTGMVSLQTLVRPPAEATSLSEWYLAGGGLRRRLRLLARTADLFARLHGKGLIYSDPSPQNIFVSEATDANEVRLIDTDNLRHATTVGQTFFTPGYGAPELVSGRGMASSLSDGHAFAVLAFQTLTAAHPLLGDLVQEGEPELEEQALLGQFPWIDHPEDDRNRASHGIPRRLVLSRHLGEDFAKTFGPGLADPLSRPGMARWAEHLHRAANNTLACPACASTYYRGRSACPWCDAPAPAYVSLDCMLWDPHGAESTPERERWASKAGLVRERAGGQDKVRLIDSAVVGCGDLLELTDRFTHGGSCGIAQIRVHHRDSVLVIEALVPGPWRLVSSDGRGERTLNEAPVELPLTGHPIDWMLRTGNRDRLHRIIRIHQKAGAGS